MSLPINAMPTYNLILPGKNTIIKYRPFIVKEHKIILEAKALGDPDHMLDALQEIMASCTFNKVDISSLSTFEFDYVFLQVKAKSSGEVVPVTYTCPVDSCGKQTVVNLNISDSTIVYPEGLEEAKLVIIDPARKLGMKLKVPTFRQMSKLSKQTKDPSFLDLFAFSAIESIFDGDAIFIPGKDYTTEELAAFLDQQDESVITRLNDFIERLPYVALKTKIRCPHCGNKDDLEIKNLEDFFG